MTQGSKQGEFMFKKMTFRGKINVLVIVLSMIIVVATSIVSIIQIEKGVTESAKVKIREISEQFGCRQISDGRDLYTIKEKRNKLAHGEYTFTDIGKEYTVSDMRTLKESVKSYLTQVMNEIEKFINNNGYSTTKSTY